MCAQNSFLIIIDMMGNPKKCQVTEGGMTTFRMEKKKSQVEIGHCRLMSLDFYFSLHLLGGMGGCRGV